MAAEISNDVQENMKHLEKKCMSCQHYRPVDVTGGLCRHDRSLAPDYPVKAHGDCCDHWKTSGQQYYIRAGWLKKQLEAAAGVADR